MEISTKEQDGVLVAKIVGRLIVSSDVKFKMEMAKQTEGSSKVVLDCSEMDYLDSTGLGLIVRFYKDFSSIGGKFALAGLQPKPKLVFEITRAYKIFDIFETVDEAVSSVNSK